MIRTRRPKTKVPLEHMSAKVSPEVKEAVVKIADSEERSISQVVEMLLRENPKVSNNIGCDRVAA